MAFYLTSEIKPRSIGTNSGAKRDAFGNNKVSRDSNRPDSDIEGSGPHERLFAGSRWIALGNEESNGWP